jgi:hypothetical protein
MLVKATAPGTSLEISRFSATVLRPSPRAVNGIHHRGQPTNRYPYCCKEKDRCSTRSSAIVNTPPAMPMTGASISSFDTVF